MSNNPLQDIVAFGSGDLISSLANYAQLTDLSLQIKDLSNTQLLVKICERLERQDKEFLSSHMDLLIRLIKENEEILSNQKKIMAALKIE